MTRRVRPRSLLTVDGDEDRNAPGAAAADELEERINARREDSEFMARVRRLIDENRPALDLLAR